MKSTSFFLVLFLVFNGIYSKKDLNIIIPATSSDSETTWEIPQGFWNDLQLKIECFENQESSSQEEYLEVTEEELEDYNNNIFTFSKNEILKEFSRLQCLCTKNFSAFAILGRICKAKTFWCDKENCFFLLKNKFIFMGENTFIPEPIIYFLLNNFCKKNMFHIYIDKTKMDLFLQSFKKDKIKFSFYEGRLYSLVEEI